MVTTCTNVAKAPRTVKLHILAWAAQVFMQYLAFCLPFFVYIPFRCFYSTAPRNRMISFNINARVAIFKKSIAFHHFFFSSSFTIRWPIHRLLSWINQITHGLAIRDVLNTRMYYLRCFILRIFGTNSLILVVLCCCPYFVGWNWVLPANARLKLSWFGSGSSV